MKFKKEDILEGRANDSCKTKFGMVSRGDVVVILKKDGSRSVVRVAKFRESASSPSDKPVTMIEYVEIYPEISFEPLISVENFENMIKLLKPVMRMSDQEWDKFYDFLRQTRSLRTIKEAWSKLETPNRAVIRRSPFKAYLD